MSATFGESGRPFEELLGIVREAASGRTYQRALGAVGRELGAVVREAFDGERSPGGIAWKPLRRPRPGRILERSGRLRKGATRVLFAGQRIVIDLPSYGPFHQDGTGRMPARAFLPDVDRDAGVRLRLERVLAASLDTST